MNITKEEIEKEARRLIFDTAKPMFVAESGNGRLVRYFRLGAEFILSKLSDKPTGAITEAAHSANTMLSEVPTSESDTHIGDVGADSSETEIVKQNEQTKELCRHDWESTKDGMYCKVCDKYFDED